MNKFDRNRNYLRIVFIYEQMEFVFFVVISKYLSYRYSKFVETVSSENIPKICAYTLIIFDGLIISKKDTFIYKSHIAYISVLINITSYVKFSIPQINLTVWKK